MAQYQEALRLNPDYAEAHSNLGVALKDQGQLAEAVAQYQEAFRLKPDYAEAHLNLGNALREQGQLAEAVAQYQEALRLNPDYAMAHNNLGNVLRDQGQLAEAVSEYQEALRLKPDFAEAHNNLGNALWDQGQLTEAVAQYQEALRLKPDYAEAHLNLGYALRDQGQLAEAVAQYQEAFRLKPDNLAARGALVHELQHLCIWENLGERARGLIDAVAVNPVTGVAADAVPPFTFLALPTSTTAELQLRCARNWVKQRLRSAVPSAPETRFLGETGFLSRPDPARSRLRLGYLSADFHTHATAMLIAELFEQHDRARFEVFGYSYGPDDGSPMRRRLVQAFDRFIDIRDASIQESAQRIQQDGVDILVDLKGHTRDARTRILALRPAPLQVNYLGYPGTMGASFMDYILVDDFIVPPEQQPFFTEQLVYLPGCYQVNDSRREIAAQTPTRAACGLPQEGFVFCCFNNSYKITPEVFSVWMRLMQAVPGSVLWLLEGNRWAPANLRREAEARGVTGERLVFAPKLAGPEHLARHRLADLFLDTYPYNAHTTASDALWAGCPVLTLAGETFASRVAGSLLRTLGLLELITTSLDAYEALALELSQDAGKLVALRGRLEASRVTSSLFDGGQFARNIEKAFATMWVIHTAGDTPRGFAVSAT